MKDARAQLEAIAAGQVAEFTPPDVLSADTVEKNYTAYRAWAILAENKGREPLAAPTGLLTPLP